VDEDVFDEMARISRALFARGTEMAASRGLILVDTKYEFGWYRDELYIIDEIHTPDSSRYWYADSYGQNQNEGKAQEQLSKEFVREWLISKGFQGLEGQRMPVMEDDFVETISQRYIMLYEKMTGSKFQPAPSQLMEHDTMEQVIADELNKYVNI
jgi:phosphoribosylaminoimidazole-succinocarboxamide synthase